MHSVLSPLAPPFNPSSDALGPSNQFESMEFAIYNNGVPSMVCVGEHPEHDILKGIPDDAIDEKFPPNAEEAAEIEAVEIFVEAMATLSLLEEMEERARTSFSHVKKRWAVRRAEGLHGRPHPARSNAEPVRHGSVSSLKETDIVPYGHRAGSADIESRIRAKEERKRVVPNPKISKGPHGHQKPIQQPRKQY